MAAICGIKPWIGIHRNDTAAYLNDMILVTVNGCLAIFAFLSNLVIIVTVIKTPSLQKPCNILLSNLAFADCLTGVIVQPMFIVYCPWGKISIPHKLGFSEISPPQSLLPSNVQILNLMLINLFIIVFILLVIHCVWQINKINK